MLNNYISSAYNNIIKAGKSTKSILSESINKNSVLILTGMLTGLGAATLDDILRKNGIETGVNEQLYDKLALSIPAVMVYYGAFKNLMHYYSPSNFLDDDNESKIRVGSAGVTIHFAGEYAQLLATIYGGSDFRLQNDLKLFLTDPHMLPYWVFNIPGFDLVLQKKVSKTLVKSLTSIINHTKKSK